MILIIVYSINNRFLKDALMLTTMAILAKFLQKFLQDNKLSIVPCAQNLFLFSNCGTLTKVSLSDTLEPRISISLLMLSIKA